MVSAKTRLVFEEYIKDRLENNQYSENELVIRDQSFWKDDFDIEHITLFYPNIKKLRVYDSQSTNIEYFFLALNKIVPNLEEMELYHFQHAGPETNEFDFEENRLFIPEDINQFKKLTRLYLDDNSLAYIYLDHLFGDFKNIKIIETEYAFKFKNEEELSRISQYERISSIRLELLEDVQKFINTIQFIEIDEIIIWNISKTIKKNEFIKFKDIDKNCRLIKSLKSFSITDENYKDFDYLVFSNFKNLSNNI